MSDFCALLFQSRCAWAWKSPAPGAPIETAEADAGRRIVAIF
jgi:hypothetical protein